MKYTRLLDQKRKEKGILIASHQGYAGGNIILNTPRAMINAIRHGADIVELDIARTSDDVYYVFHQNLEPRHLKTDTKICEMTSKELDAMFLWNNANIMSYFHVSTLDHMMELLKKEDVLINLDKCDHFREELFAKLDTYGMEEQFIVKGTCDRSYLDCVANHKTKYMFMPLIHSMEDIEIAFGYGDSLNIVGIELIFQNFDHEHMSEKVINMLKDKGYYLWANAIDLGRGFNINAHIGDDISMLEDPDKGWGKLMDTGFDVLQTDFPPVLLDYIQNR